MSRFLVVVCLVFVSGCFENPPPTVNELWIVDFVTIPPVADTKRFEPSAEKMVGEIEFTGSRWAADLVVEGVQYSLEGDRIDTSELICHLRTDDPYPWNIYVLKNTDGTSFLHSPDMGSPLKGYCGWLKQIKRGP